MVAAASVASATCYSSAYCCEPSEGQAVSGMGLTAAGMVVSAGEVMATGAIAAAEVVD